MLLTIIPQGGAPAAGNAKAFDDLTTAVSKHHVNLRNANPGKDLTTLFTKELTTVHSSSANNLDDLNSATAEYLLTHD